MWNPFKIWLQPKLEENKPNHEYIPSQIIEAIGRKMKSGQIDWSRMFILGRQRNSSKFVWFNVNMTLIQNIQLIKDYLFTLHDKSTNPDYELYMQRINDDLERILIILEKMYEVDMKTQRVLLDKSRI